MKKIEITSAVSIEGKICRKGDKPTVDDKLAADLIRRGKAIEASADEEAAAEETEPEAKLKRAKKEGTTDAG